MTIRTPEELVELYQAELAEKDAMQARDELLAVLQQPGWKRIERWISGQRDEAFQALRNVKGTDANVAQSFARWQTVDRFFEDIENFIKQSVEQGEDILLRQRGILEQQFERGEYGRTDTGGDATGVSSSAGNGINSANDTY